VDAAVEGFIALHYTRVVAIASKIVGRNDARDVAQEVFARLDGSALPTAGWLYVATTHRALNVLRSQHRRTERERSLFRLQFSLRAHEPDPADVLERRQDREAVRRAISRLTDDEAQILALRYGGLKYREIAASLHVEVNQIGTRLARAERSFRREIERETS
jgi:RNA polymerase sigma factor (sigma-70 family)